MARVDRMINKKPRAKVISDSTFAQRQREAAVMVASGDWTEARPGHFVALYAMGHAKAYGVPPLELTPPARMGAAAMVAKLLRDSFGGEPQRLYAFVRWVWTREREREEWRRANNREGRRVSWQLQFGKLFLTDYALAIERAKTR